MDDTTHCHCAKLCACRLGAAAGIVWGLGLLMVGIVSIYGSYGRGFIEVMGSVYWGYVPGTWLGALIGLGYGLVDGFIATVLVAGLYNLMLGCGGCCRCCAERQGEGVSE